MKTGTKVKVTKGPAKGAVGFVSATSQGDYSLISEDNQIIWNGQFTYFPAEWLEVQE